MSARQVLEVIYSPRKAYAKIVQNLKYTGPLLILVLYIVATVGASYARGSKTYVQITVPSILDPYHPDPWTENSSIWTSNGIVSINTQDFVLSQSVQFSVLNATSVVATLKNIDPVNCSTGGFGNLTFAMKWANGNSAPTNVTVVLFSVSDADYFYHDMSELINQSLNNEWGNYTVPVGSEAEGWSKVGGETAWSNITGLEIEVVWPETSSGNLTLLVDRVFFQSDQFESSLTNSTAIDAISLVFEYFVSFALYWIFFSIALLIVTKLYKINNNFKTSLIITGYALIVFVLAFVVILIFYLVIPPLYFSVETVIPGALYQISVIFNSFVPLLMPIWAMALCAIGARKAFNITFGRCAVIGFVAILPYYLLLFL